MVKKNLYPSHQKQQVEWQVYLNTGKKKSTRNLVFISDLISPNLPIIQQVFIDLLRRHESLRTTFQEFDGLLRQIIHPIDERIHKLMIYDLSSRFASHDLAHKKAEITQFISELGQMPVDLEVGPLVSCSMLKTSPSQYKLIFTANHIIIDADSLIILEKEFSALYMAYISNQPVALSPAEYQLKDYALWEVEFYQSSVGEKNLTYWKQVFSKPMKRLELSAPWRESKPNYLLNSLTEHKGYEFTLESKKIEKVQDLSRELRTSKLCFYLSSLYIFFYALSEQKDITIGIPISNRNNKIAKNLVGFLTRAMYLRVELSEELTIKEFIASVRDTYMEALEHRIFSLESLEISIDDNCPMVLNYFSDLLNRINHTQGKYVTGDPTPHFPYNFIFREYTNGLSIHYQQQKGMCNQEKIPSMFKKYVKILSKMLDFPDQSIWQVIT